jgi:hypothetical protein
MFWIIITGLPKIIIPPSLSSLTTLLIADLASFSDLAPVQTILPVLNMSVAVFGRLSRNTSPGNLFGQYSVFLKFLRISFRLKVWLSVAEATTF